MIHKTTIYYMLALTCLVLFGKNLSAQHQKTKIGILLADLKIERWTKDRDYFLLKSKELNYEPMIGNAQNSESLQIIQADSMMNAGAKLLIIVPVDADSAAIIVTSAHEKGIKTIAYDRLIMNCDLDAYVSYDNEMVGKIMGLYMTLRLKKGSFAYIGGPKSDNNSFAIHQGLMDALKPMMNDNLLTIVYDSFVSVWSATESRKLIKEFLEKKPCPDIIFCANDELASGVIGELELRGLDSKIMVTGQDADLKACRNIVAGKQTLTIFKPIRVLAERAVLLASGLLGEIPFLTITDVNNGKKEVPSLILFPIPVDKNNLITSVIREEYHTKKQIFGTVK